MGIFNLFNKKKISTSNNIQEEFIEKVTNSSERLVSSFNDRLDGMLDYSESSLKVLDFKILSLFHENKDDMGLEMKQDIIAQAGSYIFEVARRNYGGKYYWYDKLDQPILVTGQPEFEVSILAFDKVKVRIENGEEDNIPFYFKGYTDRVNNKQSGMIV